MQARALRTWFVAVAVWSHAGVAAGACPPFTLDASKAFPAEGASAVPRDSGILVELASGTKCFAEEQAWKIDWKVTVTDPEGALVSGSIIRWHPRAACDPAQPMNLAWLPDAALGAGTKHTVTVESTDVVGTQSYTHSFSTGDEVLPPLVLEGELAASLRVESYERKLCMQPAPCGGGGCNMHPYTDVFVDVSGVRAHGGQEEHGYDYALTLSIDAPQTWSAVPQVAYGRALHASAHQELLTSLLALPEYGKPYVPCISLLVWDAAGHFAQRSVCLPAVSPEALIAAAKPDAGSNADDEGSRDEAGCACSTGSRGSLSWIAIALAWLGVLSRPRSRASMVPRK